MADERIDELVPRVLTVAAQVHTSGGDIERAAASVAEQVRALYYAGYDLRCATVKAHLLRDDVLYQTLRERQRGQQ